MGLIRKGYSFFRRDFQIQISYKLSFFFQFFGIFLSILTFYFISVMIGDSSIPSLEVYGGDYFSFVLVGLGLELYIFTSINTFSDNIRIGQMMGTLEYMMVTPTEVYTIILSSSLWSFFYATIQVVVLLLLGVFVFGLDFTYFNLLGALIILVLSIISLSSLGIISASFIMIFKQGDPINWVFTSLSSLFGGVFFPITVLPSYLQFFSYLLPITYALNGMRKALLQGLGLGALSFEIGVLLLFCLILIPLSIFSFRYAVNVARKEGSLSQY